VQVGDVVTIHREPHELKNRMLAAKALDNRASVAALILVLEHLSQMRHSWDVYAVATAQEEESMLGAMVTTYAIHPHIGLAIDVTTGDSLGVPEAETFILGKGPTIAVGPNIHPRIAERLIEIARAEEIPYQIEPCPGVTGTDAAYMQISREGIPTGLVSIPLRYLHTSVETVMATDIERAARLVALFIVGLEEQGIGNGE
jgi:endoglucanase